VSRRVDIVRTLALALCLAGCRATAPAPAPVPVPPEPPLELNSDADITAVAELLRMEDVRTLDTALVARHLASPNREVRARAALAAGRIRDSRATPLLLAALNDQHPYVRARAAFALGELGDTIAAGIIDALGAVALGPDVTAAVEAVGALGQLARPASRVYIDSLLARRTLPDSVRNEALIVAWRLPRDAGTVAHLIRFTRHPDPATRWRAAYSLARSPSTLGLPALLALMRDSSAEVRAHAVRGLPARIADSLSMRPAVLEAVLAAVSDTHPHVRINAIALLNAYREPARTTPLLVTRVAADPDDNVRIAAAQALASARDRSAASTLAAVAASTAATGVRTAALAALVPLDTAQAVQVATEWSTADNHVLRVFAARTLAQGQWAVTAPTLQRLARDANHLVAAAALNAIIAGDSLPEKRTIFIDRLRAQHPPVRAAAVRGLARYATIADFDLLLQTYDATRNDSTAQAATAVVNALSRLRRAGTPVERAFFLRFANTPPTDPALYRLITDSIGTPPPSWTAPVRRATEPRPLSFYTDIVRRYVTPVLASGGTLAPRVIITTPHGDIQIALTSADAPLTVHNFVTLIESGFYANTRWHRVVPNFVIQAGSANGDGSGGPGYSIRDEINHHRYLRGTLGMALSGPDTGGSQWFITHSPTPHLDGGYTIFGHVVVGMDVVDRVVQEEPILGFRIIR
jgi:cyclophilin family peptidyl-prolyl cis-trans isomerase/HEAT repeat protein